MGKTNRRFRKHTHGKRNKKRTMRSKSYSRKASRTNLKGSRVRRRNRSGGNNQQKSRISENDINNHADKVIKHNMDNIKNLENSDTAEKIIRLNDRLVKPTMNTFKLLLMTPKFVKKMDTVLGTEILINHNNAVSNNYNLSGLKFNDEYNNFVDVLLEEDTFNKLTKYSPFFYRKLMYFKYGYEKFEYYNIK